MSWTTWPDEKWLGNPAKPKSYLGSDAEWAKRVSFMQRKARGELKMSGGFSPLARRGYRGANPGRARPQPPTTGLQWPQRVTKADIQREKRAIEKQLAKKVIKMPTKRAKYAATERRSTPAVKVGDGPLVYTQEGEHSWFRDMYLRSAYAGGMVPTASLRRGDSPADVCDRLLRNNAQMQAKARHGTDEERALIRGFFREKSRLLQGTPSDRSGERYRDFLMGEIRTGSTATGSLGAFCPPVYLLQAWNLFRTAAAPVAKSGAQRQLPATGMVVDIPKFTSKVNISKQTPQNSAIVTSTPTTTYTSANVLTLAGGVPLSQQLFDRAGVSVDMVLTEQAAREAGTILDSQCITAILAAMPTANKITNPASSPSFTELVDDIGEGAMLIETTEGTRLPPDAVMLPPATLRWNQVQTDTNKRPLWLATPGSSPGRNGAADTATEGYSGYDLLGCRVFEDANLPITPASTVLLGNFGKGLLVYTAAPVIDVWPTWKATQLTVLLTFRQYVALAVAYPSAFVKITSATGAYPKSPTFTGA